MGYRVSGGAMDGIFQRLRKDYRVCAPVRISRGGEDIVRYGEPLSAADIVLDEKTAFSPKEVFYPPVQTMLYFTGDACTESLADERDIVLFVRPCDINGIKRLDTVLLGNGAAADSYYSRLRGRLRLFMLECSTGWDGCFCVSMDAGKTDDYSVALRFEEGGVLAQVKDDTFTPYFSAGEACDFTPAFVAENQTKVTLPRIGSESLAPVYGLDMWRDYDEQCISCGGCNTVCPTCSCFDTVDVVYSETSRDGERRRVWAGCMQEGFTTMAGGHGVRKAPGDRIRFKALHKVYDFAARFGGGHMCVGCGRCTARCPQDISFPDTINRLAAEAERIGGGR